MKQLVIALSMAVLPSILAPVRAQEQTSPDGKVTLTFSLTKEGSPAYKVSYKNKPVIKESTLGFLLKKSESLTKQFKIVNTQKTTFKETWKPVWGEEKEILNHYNLLIGK